MRFRDLVIGTALCMISFGCGILFGVTITPEKEPATLTVQGSVQEKIQEPKVTDVTPKPLATPEAEQKEERFLLTVSDDGISLYQLLSDGKTEFLYKTETEISHLRQEDYEKLCKGIIVHSEAEARTLMEDFAS